MREVVLPSGRFASMRSITWFDRVCTFDTNGQIWILKLAAKAVKIDGVDLTLAEAAEMDLVEANPIIEMISEELLESLRSKGVK